MLQPFYAVETYLPHRSIGYLVKRLAKLNASQIEARFVSQELTMVHWMTLAMISHGIVNNCAGLARQIGHDTGATTRLVDQLAARELIERRRDAADRRVVNLACTPAGLEMLKTLTPLLLEVWNDVLDEFDAIEVETLISLLTRLVDAFERRDSGARDGIIA